MISEKAHLCPVCNCRVHDNNVWCAVCWNRLLRRDCTPQHASSMLTSYWSTWLANHYVQPALFEEALVER